MSQFKLFIGQYYLCSFLSYSLDLKKPFYRRASTLSTARKGFINLVVSRDCATFAAINDINRDYETTILLADILFMALRTPTTHGLRRRGGV